MSEGATIGISIALAVLLLFSAFFSATETAFTGYSQVRMKSLAATKKSAKAVLKAGENYNKLLSTLLIGNNIVNITATSLATMLFTAHLGDLGVTISTVVMTVLVLIFGEISPKTIAKERPEEFAMFSVYIIRVLGWVFLPLTAFFDLWKKLLNKIFRLDKKRPSMTEEEFKIIVSDITAEGVLHKTEHDLIQNTMRYDDLTVQSSMIKSENITYVEIDEDLQEILFMFEQSNYSRVPVTRGGLENILGIMYRTDFYEMRLKGREDIATILKPAFYVDAKEKLPSLLRTLQKKRQHLALVREGEATVGLITIEDVIEEIFGEIEDRYDVVPNDGSEAV